MNANEIMGREEQGLTVRAGVVARRFRRVSCPIGLADAEWQTPEL